MAGVSETAPRPSHTTMAAGIVIGGSVGVVVGIAQQLSGLHSLETREAVADFLSRPPGSGLGLDVPGALELLRVALMVVAGCAAAAAVLGYHALRRSHRARLGLTVLAVPLFLGGLATGGFLTSLVAASSMLLWLGPSGEWFRGGTTPERPPGGGEGAPSPWGVPSSGHHEEAAPRRAEEDRGSPPPPPAVSPPVWQQPPPGPPAPPGRPDALVWACVLTWAFCSLTLVLLGVSAVLMSSNPDLVLAELRRQGRPVDGADLGLLQATTYVTVGAVGLWCLAATLLAGLAYRGTRWARVGLVVSAAVAAVLCLVLAVTSLVTLVPGVAALVTVLLLNRPEVRRWSRGHGPMTP